MPRGDKSSYSSKQRREAAHIEEGYEKKGVSKKAAESRAWATVNKQDGGAKKKTAGARKTTGTVRIKTADNKTATEKAAAKKTARKKVSKR